MTRIIEGFARFFAKESTMRGAFICTIALFAMNMIVKLFIPLVSLFICDTVFFICLIYLYVSFKRHNKNVQKGLLGAVLMWYLYDEVGFVVDGIILDAEVFKVYNSFSGIVYIVLSLLCAILFAGLFVNHFIINSDHHSRPVNIFINQLLIILIALFSIISIPFQIHVLTGHGWEIAEAVTWHTGLAALVVLIASYETRLDAYRIDREEAGWTEEKGYPEGYVHEYQKKQK